MNLRLILVVGLLVATAASAQERVARPIPAVATGAKPAPELSKARQPGSELEISYDARMAAQHARDIKELKAQMAAAQQQLQNQQAEIAQLRACLKIHDQRLAGMPMMTNEVLGKKTLGKPLADYRLCM